MPVVARAERWRYHGLIPSRGEIGSPDPGWFCGSRNLSLGTRVSVPGSKSGTDVKLNTPSSPEVKNEWSCTCTTPYSFMAYTEKTLPLTALTPSYKNQVIYGHRCKVKLILYAVGQAQFLA